MTVNIITLDDAQQVEPIQQSIIDIYREAFGQVPYFKKDFPIEPPHSPPIKSKLPP